MSETKTEPRWRRWGDEKPAKGEVAAVKNVAGEVLIGRNWGGIPPDDLWMPESEWRKVLDGIAKPEDPGEWVVKRWGTVERQGRYTGTVDCTSPGLAAKVAEALNRMEGR